MRLLFYFKLKILIAKQNENALMTYRDRLDDAFEKQLCDIALATLHFSQRDNPSAHRLFSKAHAFLRTRLDTSDEYLRLFCLIYISLLRQNLEAAAAYTLQGQALRGSIVMRTVFPMPDLKDKVLYRNTIESVG